jgi:acylphosphatase
MLRRVHMLVRGRVQGVYYRACAQREAESLGLSGHVRNVAGGKVEIVAEGDEEKLERLVAWAWRGSPSSHVEDVNATFHEPTGDAAGFRIVDR